LKIFGIDVSDIQMLNVEFPSVREKRVDKVYLCVIGSKRFIIQIEFQLYYEKYFTIRMLGYWTDLKFSFLEYPIMQIVLTCGKKIRDSIEEEIRVMSGGNEVLFGYTKFKYTLVDLSDIPFKRYMESVNPNINSFGILSKDCDVRELINKILEYEIGKEQTLSLITKIYILSKLTGRDKEVERVMEETQKIDLMEYDLFRKAIEKGKKEGLEKGLQKGLQKGMELAKEGIEAALRAKFGSAAYRLIRKIRKVKDIRKLREIARKIPKAKNTNEIEKILDSRAF
ncbi:MAG: hypothetical protein RMJ45_07620, partial [Candidatus Calescibacterium sp.]|nr:hypothetical protein [Candidatus Calescibacterium sp.]